MVPIFLKTIAFIEGAFQAKQIRKHKLVTQNLRLCTRTVQELSSVKYAYIY